ncbi:MarR family winged helix-turn-helix transcriptional regulator [Mesorhizobium sp. UC22_110]|uniref:MarR family winged helix-turn-helix transcriptional regulator n=1 Tax=Mesorhizobium sp. UC22_110 TaxID=3374552 RepID=UPI00375740DF
MEEQDSPIAIFEDMGEIVRRLQDIYEIALQGTGLSLEEGATLYRIAHGGANSQKMLADKLRIETPTFARLARRLEIRGLIRRFEDDSDRRVKQLFVTTEGMSLVSRFTEKLAADTAELLSCFRPRRAGSHEIGRQGHLDQHRGPCPRQGTIIPRHRYLPDVTRPSGTAALLRPGRSGANVQADTVPLPSRPGPAMISGA